jgi:hypothetical protein
VKGFILINDSNLITHPHIEVALGKGGACDTGSFFWNGGQGLRMQGHRTPPLLSS